MDVGITPPPLFLTLNPPPGGGGLSLLQAPPRMGIPYFPYSP